MPLSEPILLTRNQAAEYLGVKVGTLAVWQSSRRYHLPVVKVGRLIRYLKSDLDQWLASRRSNSVEVDNGR